MTPEQSSFLATLAYTDTLHDRRWNNHTLNVIINSSNIRDECPTGFSKKEWEALLDEVQRNPELSQMVVRDLTINGYDGGAMITLVNETTHEAAIAYQGTATPQGWDEDLKSGYTLTLSQQEAITYANTMTEKLGNGYYIYATGHSKGGNEAALAAVECDAIDRAYAFDAPGNAEAYFNDPEHARRARDNSHKVAYYSNENCFVSGMNPRYDTEEHWLESGYDEWSGDKNIAKLKDILRFSPMSHAAIHLYNANILDGSQSFKDNEVPEPSEHVKAINNLTRFLENNLRPEDCQYLLDALGVVVANLQSDNTDISEILQALDPKTIGILLALFEEYPESQKLFDALLADGWLETALEEYGADLDKYLKIGSFALGGACVIAPGLVALLGFVVMRLGGSVLTATLVQKNKCRNRIHAHKALKQAARATKRIADLLRTHDFSDAKLEMLERLVSQFKNFPIRSIYQGWQRVFGANPFFRMVNLSPIQGITTSMVSLLDSAIDSIMRTIRQRYKQAWAEDAKAASTISSANDAISIATGTLRQLL